MSSVEHLGCEAVLRESSVGGDQLPEHSLMGHSAELFGFQTPGNLLLDEDTADNCHVLDMKILVGFFLKSLL